MRTCGANRSLFIGQASTMLEQLCAALSSRGLHFYMLRPLRLTSAVSEVAMAYTQTTVGAACGVPQGELHGSLSNLRTTCTILTPMIWSRVYGYGLACPRCSTTSALPAGSCSSCCCASSSARPSTPAPSRAKLLSWWPAEVEVAHCRTSLKIGVNPRLYFSARTRS
jgi:hypothetical protein